MWINWDQIQSNTSLNQRKVVIYTRNILNTEVETYEFAVPYDDKQRDRRELWIGGLGLTEKKSKLLSLIDSWEWDSKSIAFFFKKK